MLSAILNIRSIIVTLTISNYITYIAHGLIISSLAWLLMHVMKFGIARAPYGRYCESKARRTLTLSPSLGWFVQESPSFLLPLYFVVLSPCSTTFVNKIVLGPYMIHYFFRSCFYPFQLKNGNRTPWYIVISAFIFCSMNGLMQGYYLICMASFPHDYLMKWNFIFGLALFTLGWGINIHSDFILKNLRKPGETGYKIPRGGLFELVSCANYFGEILEWWSYALISWTYPSFSFAIWSCTFLGLRAIDHHRFYLTNFKGYPQSRKAVIPFIL